MRPRRNIYEIIWDILTYCRRPRRISQIMLACNLNTKTAEKYLELLTRKGFLAKQGDMYVTTDKGREYIRLFNELYKKIFED
ncbi:winged helix-turn-helix domain-containing protein [Pyrofollis japonicus]|uniref:winged helix-turn-helix domain-containing protein n=1 Tax=Pyrofollis japonicus TaxID=3060460 RepID=UPI00295C0B4D|nr:winged helix-turn-helix domain-containing protein [Pyrofollis japonicus]